jgi:hypothetical protein
MVRIIIPIQPTRELQDDSHPNRESTYLQHMGKNGEPKKLVISKFTIRNIKVVLSAMKNNISIRLKPCDIRIIVRHERTFS